MSQAKYEETPRAKDVILLNRERRNHYLLGLPNTGQQPDSPKAVADGNVHCAEANHYLHEIKLNQ